MANLFSIENGRVSSMGFKVELVKPDPAQDIKYPIQIESLVTIGPDGQPQLSGNIIWSGRTLGDLWNAESDLFQFIEDHFKAINP